MMPARPLVLLIALAPLAALAKPAPRRFEGLQIGAPRGSGPGQVTFVTQEGAFIDRGSADGIKVGDKLSVNRRGRAIGSCDVTKVNEHSAACTGAGFGAGDRLTVERKPESPPVPIAAPPSAAELAQRLDKVEATPMELVDFSGAPVGNGQAAWLEIMLSQTSASDFSSVNGPYQVQRADVAVRDLNVWRGLHVSADLTVLNWSRRPAVFRSPLKGTPQLFVRRAEVAWYEPGGHLYAALGRVWTRHTPGLAVLDGAQVGVRSTSGELEGGAFGGLLPDPLQLGLSTTTWAAGAYGFARFYRGTGADAAWLQPELRAGWAVRNNLGGRFEVAASLHGWVGRSFDAHAMAQLAVANAPALDIVRVDLGLHPTDALRFIASARYRGNAVGEVLEVGAFSSGTQALHADLMAMFDLKQALTIVLMGGMAGDLGNSLWSGRAGAEVQLPTLFGRGGLGAGYFEELGWVRGRSAWVQASITPHWRFKLVGRGSWATQDGPTSAGLAGQEVGGSLAAEVRPVYFIWLRLSGLLRARLDGTGGAGTANAQLGVEL